MIVACDPGLKGAFAFYRPHMQTLRIVAMPTYANGKGKTTIDDHAILTLLTTASLDDSATLVIENVGGMPGQSAPAAFNFGYGVGGIVMCARALKWRIERVTPATWKAALRVPRDKQSARIRASELLPKHADLWPLKGDDGKAEAALLALYGEQFLRLT